MFYSLLSPVARTELSLEYLASKCWMNRGLNEFGPYLPLHPHVSSLLHLFSCSHLSNLPAFSRNVSHFSTSLSLFPCYCLYLHDSALPLVHPFRLGLEGIFARKLSWALLCADRAPFPAWYQLHCLLATLLSSFSIKPHNLLEGLTRFCILSP